MEPFLYNMFYQLSALLPKKTHPDPSRLIHCLKTNGEIAKTLTFNLGVKLLMEHLTAPEGGKMGVG